MKQCTTSLLLTILYVATLFQISSQAESVTLNPSADAALFEQSPLNNQGANDTVPAGSTAKGLRSRALFQFDLSSIPSGATILSAKLTLTITKAPLGGGSASTFRLHRVTTPWSEGTKKGNTGQKAVVGATWESATTPSLPWTTIGGDFAPDPSSSIEMNTPGTYAFLITPELIADVQEWLASPDSNSGWILISDSESTKGTARRFASREHPESPPQLEIEYETKQVAIPLSMAMKELTSETEARMIITGKKSTQYLVESSEDLIAWTERAEIQMSSDSETVEYLDPDILNNPHRFYRSREVNSQTMAHILSAQASGESSNYFFTVTIQSPDLGCNQYANWWEVLSESGDLLYRRILTHSHVNEQPFSRMGGAIPITSDEPVYIRAHMNTAGYGGMAFHGTVESGFFPIALSADFASALATSAPLPAGCDF